MKEKLKLSLPVIVEGKYDKLRVAAVADADIFTTDGFAVFNSKEKLALFCRLAEKNGVILLTDSDGAGKVIRRYLTSAIPKEKLYQLHIPRVPGKEKRKKKPSAEGILGVEGTDTETLARLLSPFAGGTRPRRAGIEKRDLMLLGFSGGPESKQKRAALARDYGLPEDMTANALLAALNILADRESFLKTAKTV